MVAQLKLGKYLCSGSNLEDQRIHPLGHCCNSPEMAVHRSVDSRRIPGAGGHRTGNGCNRDQEGEGPEGVQSPGESDPGGAPRRTEGGFRACLHRT